MGKKKDAEPEQLDAEDKAAARDYMLARLAACRSAIDDAKTTCDALIAATVDPEANGDEKGKRRENGFEDLDDALGRAAIASGAAREAWGDVDPEMGEPDDDDDED